jgi:predicted Zn-dependent protease
MAKVGRNQPCPCGSGKKYKQCCLAADEAAAGSAGDQQRRDAPPTKPVRVPMFRWMADVLNEDEELDQRLTKMSNDTVDLITDGKLDEAERMCQRLLDEFPELPDGHIRLGQLFRARGEPKRAAQHLRLAAAACRALSSDPDMPNSLDAEADGLDPRT